MLIVEKNIINEMTFPYSEVIARTDYNFIIITFGKVLIFKELFTNNSFTTIIPTSDICINYERSFSFSINPGLPLTDNHFDYTVISIHDVVLPLDPILYPNGISDVLQDDMIEKNILHQGIAYQQGEDNNPVDDIYK